MANTLSFRDKPVTLSDPWPTIRQPDTDTPKPLRK